MKLTKVQNRFIKNKNMGFSLMKGKSLTGKTITALHRVINLENNYCLYKDDKVLFLSSNSNELINNNNLYENISKESEFYSLFSLSTRRVEFNLIDSLIKEYSNKYLKLNGLNLELVSFDKGFELLNSVEFNEKMNWFLKKSKVLNKISAEELYNEIMWIKSCNFTKEEYNEVERKGRKYRIIRNSFTREAIYSLKKVYNDLLIDNGFYDIYDETSFAIKYAKENNNNNKYTHIVLDNVESLTKGQIEFAKSIYANCLYSSFVFIINNDKSSDDMCWLVKGRKLKTLGADFKGKSFAFKKSLLNKIIWKIHLLINMNISNLKYKNIVGFNLDNSSPKKEIYLNDNTVFSEEELEEVDVYNDIAAGNPIEINEEVLEKFLLPKGWLEKGKDTFILHVKGDSMIDKNINDGDMVVIKRQNTAYNNEIVAASLDGEATLKTLKLNGEAPMLVPANPKYSEIYLEGKEVSILGVAIGVIKNKLN